MSSKKHEPQSAFNNSFDPLHPKQLDGYFSNILFADPVEIKAPLELVWEIITDFPAYPTWNPLNRSMKLDTTANLGERVTFGVSWGPYLKNDRIVPLDELKIHRIQHETLTIWETNHCLAYADDLGVWHRAERVQVISQLPNGNTRYQTYEHCAGLITPLIQLAYGKKTLAGFNAVNLALKKRAEALENRETF